MMESQNHRSIPLPDRRSSAEVEREIGDCDRTQCVRGCSPIAHSPMWCRAGVYGLLAGECSEPRSLALSGVRLVVRLLPQVGGQSGDTHLRVCRITPRAWRDRTGRARLHVGNHIPRMISVSSRTSQSIASMRVRWRPSQGPARFQVPMRAWSQCGVMEHRGSSVRLDRQGVSGRMEQISCGIPEEFGRCRVNESGPRSCVSAGQGPFSGYGVTQTS